VRGVCCRGTARRDAEVAAAVMVERKRGRAGQEQRRRRLRLHPNCAECWRRGLVRATKIIDHIRPLALGGSDDDENTQGLCLLCSAIKTATESASAGGAANWPEWLEPSAVPLEIVCGPPFSGKATYVAARASAEDVVIEFDAIAKRLSADHRAWRGIAPDLFNRTIRTRNALLGSLARLRGETCSAFFVIGAPTLGERQWWQRKLGGAIVLMDPGVEECRRRALATRLPQALAAVDRWRAASRLSWSPPVAKLARRGSGDDGYPLEA
jgi:hypothetical protein